MFAKVFAQIFDSSIADNWKHRHVFEDLLKLADRHGIVDMTPEAICARTRLPREMVDEALEALSNPDPRSRSKEENGRRIVLIDPERSWGWRIVNYLKYREMRTEFDRTAYMRDYMRDYRALNSVKPQSNNVKLTASVSVPASDSEKEGSLREGKRLHGIPSTVDEVIAYGAKLSPVVTEEVCRDFWAHYEGQARTNPNGELFWVTSGEAVVTNWKVKLPSFRGLHKNNNNRDHRAEKRSREFDQHISAKDL